MVQWNTWNTMCYSVSNKQKPSPIPSRKCANCVWASVVQLVAKISDIESFKTGKFKFKLDKFLEFISDEPKIPNYVTSARSNSILDQPPHLRAQGFYQGGGAPDSATEQA